MTDNPVSSNFIRHLIDNDIAKGNCSFVVTRFPPEPNGFLHIGHAKSICLNFGLAKNYSGRCFLRFDDTNPNTEESSYVEMIKRDITWLGFSWYEQARFTSDYFPRLHDAALTLIRKGKAYVDSLSAEEIREYRGTLTMPGRKSPDRNRDIADNLDLFSRMKAGEFDEGEYVLRAKIDMSSGNINMRDPVMYRICKAAHHLTKREWRIYPMYDFAHCISDAIEEVTHSICTLEFEDHRPLYDWYLEALEFSPRPQQIEFARLALTHTLTSKRKLNALVRSKQVIGWDDPRLLTLSGMRRRGFSPEVIRDFCERVGVTKSNATVDYALLESIAREHLNKKADRAFAVLCPLRVVLTNYPEGKTEMLSVPNHPQDASRGERTLCFERELYIERDDFMDVPTSRFYRLAPGREVRLRYAYVIRCDQVIMDSEGQPVELRCTYDAASLGGKTADGRKVKGIVHWLSAKEAINAEVRLYDRLLLAESLKEEADWMVDINPDSLLTVRTALVERSLQHKKAHQVFQFERLGYFCRDFTENKQENALPAEEKNPVFNRTVTLRAAADLAAPQRGVRT